MDSLKEIAIAEIASIFSKHRLIKTYDNPLIWRDLLNRSGQRKLFEINADYLTPYEYNQGHSRVFRNPNILFEEFYGAIYDILNKIYNDGTGMDELTLLLKNVIEEISIYDVISFETIDESKYDIWEIEEKKSKKLDRILKEEPDKDLSNYFIEEFQKLIRSLRFLSLDVVYKDKKLTILPFSQGSFERVSDISHLEKWLATKHPECLKSYEDALNNYKEGRAGSCISDCRVTLTGLFSNFSETENWFNGVFELNSENYKDPQTLSKLRDVSKILYDKLDGNFPRFKAIYKIYGMFCDLGSHRTEQVEEEPTLNDALLSLRFTEDILIWAMNINLSKPNN